MSTATVRKILKGIDALGDADRRRLDQELAKRFEKEWATETANARRTARKRKIDQHVIDAAIERRRYRR